MYWEQKATIRIDDDCSVRQGCVFSPDLFNIYSEIILRNIGVRVGGYNINNLRYADDTALIADSEEKLRNIFTTVTVENENTHSESLHMVHPSVWM